MNYIKLFHASVLQYPKNTAIVDCDGMRTTSYAELDLLSSRVAGKLRTLGCGPEKYVGVCMDRRMEYIAAYLGILKAGSAVVPMVPDYPRDRCDYITHQCGAVLTVGKDFFDDIERFEPVDEPANGAEPALLIYTSGSTGTPKGILYTAEDLARTAVRQTALLDGLPNLNFAAACMFSFIAHITEYLSVFLMGGCSHILPDEVRRSADELAAYYSAHNITAGVITTQLMRLFHSRSTALRRVITGSERVSMIYSNSFEIYNVYGMSELGHTGFFSIDRPYENTPVGKAIGEVQILICDESGTPLPNGSEGEIILRGCFHMTYFCDEQRTAKYMTPAGDGLTDFHTGDIGRLNENGDLIFLNRKDWMVKINGQRVETMEIETLLQAIPEVKNAAVKAFTDEDGQTLLVAYYVSCSPLLDEALREALRAKLPAYMIPRYFVGMDTLPKNINGKLDRKALLPPTATRYKVRYVAPTNQTEQLLCNAFEQVLHCGRVGIEDDFFALGGDSIKALKLIACSQLKGLSLDTVFNGKTPKNLAALANKSSASSAAGSCNYPAVCPLNAAQLGVYLECVEKPNSVKYNISVRAKLPQGTDIPRFITAVETVLDKHPAFSVTVGAPDGVPSMLYHKRKITVEEVNAQTAESESLRLLRPYNLEQGPLCRFEVAHLPECNYFLYDLHHLIYDGSSQLPFLSQIAQVYDGGECGEESMTLFDEALVEAAPKDPARLTNYREYFDKLFADVDCDAKPLPDRLTDGIPDTCACLVLRADEKFRQTEVTDFVRGNGISENALFLGAFGYALAKCNGAQQSFFNTANHGRRDARLADTVGMFVQMLPIVCRFDENMNPADYLRGVYDDYFHTKKNDVIPFAELSAQYGANTDISFIYQGDLLDGVPLAGGILMPENIHTSEAIADMEIMLIRAEGGYRIQVYYRTALYSEDFIRGFIGLFLNTVRGMITAKALREIVLTDTESRTILNRFNATQADYRAEKTTVDLFREQVEKTPDKTCLVYCDRRYTYRQVDELTDNLAAELLRRGVGKEKVVGILIPRCEYMLLCALGVLKAGGAYLPLDPTYPADRLNLMMLDSAAMLLIADPALTDTISADFTGDRLLTDTIPSLPKCDIELPQPKPEDLFVMLYTSGSTGIPKGVMYQHSNSFVTTQWVKKYFGIDESSRVTAYASYGFDANTFDMYPAVTGGAELHIISEDIRLDFIALRDYFNKNGITHTVMTTQVGRQFALMGGLKTLRHLSVAGEKLTPLDIPEGFSLYNLYGPSEGSVITSAFRIDRRYKDIPIGTPVDNLKMYIVDGQGRLLPPGMTGELWIAGPHVTRGYLNRPEKMAEAYGETNPFDSAPDYQRIYRTGDIVRILPDSRLPSGCLQYVGRRDAQVKVRGFRVELTEIEEIVRRFPGITDATVAAFDDPAGGKFVCAYVVSDAPVSSEALSSFIREEKPPYMVPAVIMQIDAIPLNQNQKVNKKALPIPERKIENIIPPKTDMQKRVFEITSGILGHDGFGIRTSLYDAGLTSIGALRLNVALSEEFGVPVKLGDIKANDTVELLERFLAQSAPSESYALQPDYPITQTQNGIFVECMANPGATLYNIPVLFRLAAAVDLQRLSDAVKCAVDAHPYLKTVLFTTAEGSVRAKRQDDAPVDISIIKCETLPQSGALLHPFELIGGQLYRIAIYETETGNYLFMDFHHIISDGTSEAILLQDIDRAYLGEKLQREAFTGFEAALAEETRRNSDDYEAAKAYWSSLLSDTDGSCLPAKAPESTDGGAGNIHIRGTENAVAIKSFCEANSLTLNAFFNAAFSLVLSRFVNKDRVSYATVYNGRDDSRLAGSVTMLVKTVPTAFAVQGNTAVKDHIRNVQAQLMDSIGNDACSFAELASWFDVSADCIFIYQGENFRFTSLCGEPAQLLPIASETAKAPISVNVYLVDGCFEYDVEYRRDWYCAAFAESLVDAVMTASDAFLSEKTLQDVSICSARAEAIYAEMNASETPVKATLCPQFVEHWAAKTPDALAVIAAGETMTFRQLNEQANKMANALVRLGVQQNNIVGLVLDRTKEVLITELAILKAGGAFLPMIPTYPDERIDYCLTNSESPFVITTESIAAEKPGLFADEKPYRTLTVEQLLSGRETDNLNTEILPQQMAYCIYTSGSTGTPKGVMIAHHNLSNFVQTDILPQQFYSDPSANGACLATSSISFDMSLFEIWLPLCSGKTVCMATEEEFHNPLMLRDLMLKNNVQAMTCTPSFLNNMLSMPGFDQALRGLRTVVVGAEAFPSALYDALHTFAPALQIINGYGPTETTICCSMKELCSGSGITIGRPTGNNKYYVLDGSGHIQPPYAAGELIICGAGVGRGYIKLSEKNATSFFMLRGLPAYHSGDSVRLNALGEIEFGGRIDNQVKLRGFRVELDEIENVMCSFGPVKQSKVLVRNNGTEDYLAGFFTATESVDLDALTAHLKTRLTYYMVPAALMQLEQMPLTPNGKIDKKGFPEVQQTARKSTGRRAAKKSLEQRLCEIFSGVLGMGEVYADDNFFELGGTSLSASKVTMVLMSDNIEVKYGDIFDHPTPEALAEFIEQRGTAVAATAPATVAAEDTTRDALRCNTVSYAAQVKREGLGNILLTGAVGFLGIHILRELIVSETGHIYCLIRKGSFRSIEVRLRTMLFYYFSDSFDDALRDRITLIDADITDKKLGDILTDIPFDTVINSAACVKHFSDSDILEQINVHGVENLIEICKNRHARLIQISTTSVPGIHTKESYKNQVTMHENELFVVDDMNNKYVISKYHAELAMFDAIESGMRGKVIRVGNLMGRHSDGEFQINLKTNMFISGIRGFAALGKYPISHMTDPMRFSPVDCTARAVVLLSGTNDQFTAFNCDNRYGFDEMKLIDACNRNGITILPTEDEAYYAEYRQKLADDKMNSKLTGLAAYDIQDAHAVNTDNLFTTNILYRIGFSWPLVDDTYLDRAIHSIMTLGYFDLDSQEEN